MSLAECERWLPPPFAPPPTAPPEQRPGGLATVGVRFEEDSYPALDWKVEGSVGMACNSLHDVFVGKVDGLTPEGFNATVDVIIYRELQLLVNRPD